MARKGDSSSGSGGGKVREYLLTRPTSELVELILTLAGQNDAIREQLEELVNMETAPQDQLAEEARQEIRERTEEQVEGRRWNPCYHLPDYSKLRGRFEALFAARRYDVLVELGQELFQRGQKQLEYASDNGETGNAI